MKNLSCEICGGLKKVIFEKKILTKYVVKYFQCKNCKIIDTEKPYWLNEAYEFAITNSDVGLVSRNLLLVRATKIINLLKIFSNKNRCLDYAGGYGLFVRMMRDLGFNFYRQDKFCINLFAKYFDLEDLNSKNKQFSFITCFELFEHFYDVNIELEKILELGSTIFFTTSLIDGKMNNDIKNWWYISPETGQHITFYSKESLKILAQNHGLNFYSDGEGMHIFTKNRYLFNPFIMVSPIVKLLDLFGNKSKFVQNDYKYIYIKNVGKR